MIWMSGFVAGFGIAASIATNSIGPAAFLLIASFATLFIRKPGP